MEAQLPLSMTILTHLIAGPRRPQTIPTKLELFRRQTTPPNTSPCPQRPLSVLCGNSSSSLPVIRSLLSVIHFKGGWASQVVQGELATPVRILAG